MPVSLPPLTSNWLAWLVLKPAMAAIFSAKAVKPPENEDGRRPVRPHRPDQRPGAGVQRDALGDHLVDGVGGQAGEQRDPLAQRRLELDLAAHGALGDRRDLRLQAGEVGELVKAFLTDDGRIHVGDEEAFPAVADALHDNVHRPAPLRAPPAWRDASR